MYSKYQGPLPHLPSCFVTYFTGTYIDRCSSERGKVDTEQPYRTHPPQNRLPYLLDRRKENRYNVARNDRDGKLLHEEEHRILDQNKSN